MKDLTPRVRLVGQPSHDLSAQLTERSRLDLHRRNAIFERFFRAQAPRLAEASREMSQRFLAGGRLLAFGQGAASTDAQHVSVEFVHPVIVGKRALPAVDLGMDMVSRLPVILRPHDMVMGFAFGDSDPLAETALSSARQLGAMTFGMFAESAEYRFELPDADPFVCQEVFEVLYHILWETVHVYFEHRQQGHDVGASSFLYPFLGNTTQEVESVTTEVEASMLQKMQEVNALREKAAASDCDDITSIAGTVASRLAAGGKLLMFGNGGSATDANDFALDCVAPPPGMSPIPAISLAAESANITAIANDIGADAIFTRQLIAHALETDVAIGISTSGSSANILSALAEGRRRGLATVAIVGYDGGRVVAEGLTDHSLVVRSDYIPRIQEVQASLYHVLRHRIDELIRA